MRRMTVAGVAATLLLGAGPAAAAARPDVGAPPAMRAATPVPTACAPGPAYYAIELFTTKNLPGTGYARGVADVTVSASSPFSVALAADGSYRYDVAVSLERMRQPRAGVLVAWLTTPQVDQIVRIGALDEHFGARGTVAWNQFLVVVTLEAEDDPSATTWSGPIALRGMSRSGMMHTMVGHGALQQENCAAYGYGG